MFKRSVRQKQQNKENSPAYNRSPLKEQQENYPEKDPKPVTFYLIVEAAACDSLATGRSQYWLISSKNIVDIPVVSPETVYTGKQLKFRLNDQRVSSGTCVLFSADFSFVQAQFRQIAPTMEAEKPAAPKVLNNSTRANILGFRKISNGVKLPPAITVTMKDSVHDKHLREIPQLGDPDAENKPPGQKHGILTISGGGARAMTFDQQSQTDSKMWDVAVPATASQMHQQSSQLAQLIRANNGLVNEVKQLKETTTDIKQTVDELKTKLDHALGLLMAQSKMSAEPIKEEESVEMPWDETSRSGVIHYDVDPYASLSNLSTAVPSREQSVARSVQSENTPPLKKNKAKLNESLRMTEEPPAVEFDAEDMLTIGDHGTKVPKVVFNGLKYHSYSSVTRKILSSVFDRATLASHSLTGKPSPAFMERGAKSQLDEKKIADIVKYVSESCDVSETAVRGIITSKCADENKMMRLHAKKRQSAAGFEEAEQEIKPTASKRRQTMHH